MSRAIRLKQKFLREENKRFGPMMLNLPEAEWPPDAAVRPREVWRSSEFLVQVFPMQDGAARMTVCRTMVGDDGDWLPGITWDQLLRVKEQCGYGRDWAVELFPPSAEVVNVANMRHLWLIPEAPAFAWRKQL